MIKVHMLRPVAGVGVKMQNCLQIRAYTEDQKFLHRVSHFRLANLRMSSLNRMVR